jgi:5-formyltetrahydrofolate cyclo-ligase
LRTIVKSRLANLSPEQRVLAGNAAARHFFVIPRLDNFRSVLIFESMKDELDTRPLMEAARKTGKPVFVPRIEGDMLGFYAALPPSGAHEFSITAVKAPPGVLRPEHFPTLVLTPGLAFDRQFNRLGRGRGSYDRFFAGLDAEGQRYTAIGLCMDCQLVDDVPAEAWDKTMDMLLTESGLLRG